MFHIQLLLDSLPSKSNGNVMMVTIFVHDLTYTTDSATYQVRMIGELLNLLLIIFAFSAMKESKREMLNAHLFTHTPHRQ